jgi:hypothetical protein
VDSLKAFTDKIAKILFGLSDLEASRKEAEVFESSWSTTMTA